MPSRNSEDDLLISSRAHRSKGFLKDQEWRGRGGRFREARGARRARWLSSTMAFKWAAVLGMLAMAACTSGSSGPTASIAASTPPESQAESPSPVQCPWPDGGSCLGPLAAGTYTTSAFQPTLTYRLPAGWGNFEDLPGNFLLIPPGGHVAGVDPGTSDYVGVYTSVAAETPRCAAAPDAGSSPAQLARYFASDRELETMTPEPVVVGGLRGFVLDLQLAKDAHTKLVCLIVGVPPSGLEHGVGPGLAMRLYLLANHDPIVGGTVAIEIDDVSGGGHLNKYSAVVKNFRFGT